MLEEAVVNRRQEGRVAKAIENQTTRVPSDVFLWAAAAAAGVSMVLQATNRPHRSLFVGQWVPAILLLGVYNKIVKVAGSDSEDAPNGLTNAG